jgi:ribonuclease R
MKTVVGTFEQVKNYGFVMVDDKRFGEDVYIDKKDTMGAVTGHKVVVRITKPPTEKNNPEGKVVEILGHINDPGVDILSIIKEYDLPTEFPDKVLNETANIPEEVAEEDKVGRADYRNVQMVTIDGEDAKDLDDAVSVERLENGNYKLGVYIADVSHYVREGTPLDKEAYKRGTSVYLVDRVIPMLPHRLSNGICSLNQGCDRLSLCCIMELDGKGNVVSSDIEKAVINVDRRMSYTVVNDLLTNPQSPYKEEYNELMPMFERMQELRNILFNKRRKRGAIEFDFKEAKIILDENGKPVDVKPYERNIATSIIEEFMLAANECIAEHYYWLELPFVYRVHENPKEEKVERLQEFIGKMGYVIKGNSNHPKSFQKLLDEVKGKNEELVVHKMVLRSLQRAKYTPKNDIHFGLAANYYCHFTSPIRRYPDLQIHRIISENIDGLMSAKRIATLNKKLPEIAEHCSVTERSADDAERDTDKYKIAQYMKTKIGQEFDGIVSGVTAWGMYVELENTVEGLVSIRDMYDDVYIYDEENLLLFGDHTHKTYTIGDKVKIKVTGASLSDKTVDFEVVEKYENR